MKAGKTELNIYQKLAKIRKQVEVMKKDAKGFNYTYVKEEDILAKVTAFMDKYDLSLIPGIKPGTLNVIPYSYKKTRVKKNGDIYEENVNEIIVFGDTSWTWVNNDNPEEMIRVPWTFVGQQGDSSQAFGSGLTYSSRYFLLKYFNISTPNDDPDKWRSKQHEAEAAEDKMIAESIIEQVDILIREYLAEHDEQKENVLAFAKKFVKDGNYFNIGDSVLAGKFYNDFKETFLKEDE